MPLIHRGNMKFNFLALMSVSAIFAIATPSMVFAQSLDLQAGGAAVIAPKYEGSKDYEVRGFPIIAPAGGESSGFVQFRGVDDLRFRVFEFNGFEAGPLAGYRFGRDEDDAARLTGLGDVDGGVVVGGYAAYNFGSLKPFLSYHHQVTGDDAGAVLRAGAETRFSLTPNIIMTAVAGASYADDDYMQSYFSVTAAQALASGLSTFDADGGFKDVYLSLGTDVPLSDQWSMKLGVKYTHLIGDASDSPIVETDSQLSGLLGFTYRFGVAR